MTGTDAEILEFNVPPNARITRENTEESRISERCNCRRRYHAKGFPFIATGDTIIKANDKVVVFYTAISI
jgi:Trk K+ transport system NAD-binding subunit